MTIYPKRRGYLKLSGILWPKASIVIGLVLEIIHEDKIMWWLNFFWSFEWKVGWIGNGKIPLFWTIWFWMHGNKFEMLQWRSILLCENLCSLVIRILWSGRKYILVVGSDDVEGIRGWIMKLNTTTSNRLGLIYIYTYIFKTTHLFLSNSNTPLFK